MIKSSAGGWGVGHVTRGRFTGSQTVHSLQSRPATTFTQDAAGRCGDGRFRTDRQTDSFNWDTNPLRFNSPIAADRQTVFNWDTSPHTPGSIASRLRLCISLVHRFYTLSGRERQTVLGHEPHTVDLVAESPVQPTHRSSRYCPLRWCCKGVRCV